MYIKYTAYHLRTCLYDLVKALRKHPPKCWRTMDDVGPLLALVGPNPMSNVYYRSISQVWYTWHSVTITNNCVFTFFSNKVSFIEQYRLLIVFFLLVDYNKSIAIKKACVMFIYVYFKRLFQ